MSAIVTAIPRLSRGASGRLNQAKELIAYRGGASAITVTATELTLEDSAGNPLVVKAAWAFTLNPSLSGAGGLDFGAEASSTWYNMWGIYKPDGTRNGVLSLQDSTGFPALPSGYTHGVWLGQCYNNSSGDLVVFKQTGLQISCVAQSALSGGGATTYTSVSLSAIIPPLAGEVVINQGVAASSGTATVTSLVTSLGSGTTATYGFTSQRQQTGGTSATYQQNRHVLNAAQTLYYYCSGTNAVAYIDVTGWSYA